MKGQKNSSTKNSSKSNFSTVRADWTPENHGLFVDLCLDQISLGNRPESHLTPQGWKNLLDSFESMTGLRYSRIQMKNHWDVTKKQWLVWHKLISTESLKWDPSTRSFGGSEVDWNLYLEKNPEAAQFRNMELLYADKLDIMFSGTTDPELAEETSTFTDKINRYMGDEHTTRRNKKSKYLIEKESPSYVENQQYRLNSNVCVPGQEIIGPRPDGTVEHCNDTVESRSGIFTLTPPLKFNYSIEECIKCLDSTEELEQGSELYLFALDIFLKKEYREIFLNLKKSTTRIAWLKRLQSVGPPLPLN